MKLLNGPPKGIVVHHSLTEDGKVPDYDAIKKYHIEEKGWDDIGYHWVIELQGDKIATIEGRPANTYGGHTVGHNDMVGICVVGNYDVGHDILFPEKMDALVALTKNLMNMYGFTTADIHKHHEYAPKTCPGSGFPWDEFIGRLA
jgi:N-acetylmuramoyl-L-alanine amidase